MAGMGSRRGTRWTSGRAGFGRPIAYLVLAEGTPVLDRDRRRIGVVDHVVADVDVRAQLGIHYAALLDGGAGAPGRGRARCGRRGRRDRPGHRPCADRGGAPDSRRRIAPGEFFEITVQLPDECRPLLGAARTGRV
jgi:hypothetical protein